MSLVAYHKSEMLAQNLWERLKYKDVSCRYDQDTSTKMWDSEK